MYYLVGSVPFCYPKVDLKRSKIPSFFNKLEKIGFAQKNIICSALHSFLGMCLQTRLQTCLQTRKPELIIASVNQLIVSDYLDTETLQLVLASGQQIIVQDKFFLGPKFFFDQIFF